jgi:hypothetical protein
MIKSNVRSHSTFRSFFAAIVLLFVAGVVVQPAVAVVIPETTAQLPSLAAADGELFIAWAGTDSNNSLNVAASSNGTTFGAPVGYGSNSSLSDTGPAITAFSGLYMVWVGSGNNLNSAFSVYTSAGLHFQDQRLVGYTSTCSPALTETSTVLYLAYCSGGIIQIVSSVDGVNWSTPTYPPIATTNGTPALAIYGSDLVVASYDQNANEVIIYTAPATLTLPTPGSSGWTQNTEVAGVVGGPGLASYNGSLYLGVFNTSDVGYVYTLQTGSNGLIGVVSEETVPGTVTSATNPALAVFDSHLYFAWKGTDNPAHLNIVEVF